jgi:hypothetical protein
MDKDHARCVADEARLIAMALHAVGVRRLDLYTGIIDPDGRRIS